MSSIFIGPPKDDSDVEAEKAPATPNRKTEASNPKIIETPSTVASSIGTIDESPGVLCGAKRAIAFPDEPGATAKRTLIDEVNAGASLFKTTDIPVADREFDPQDPPASLFPWHDLKWLSARASAICEDKSRDNPTLLGDIIDCFLSPMTHQDLKIHLAIVSPLSELNEKKSLVKDKLKKAIKSRFYPDFSFEQDAQSIIETVQKLPPTLHRTASLNHAGYVIFDCLLFISLFHFLVF